MKRLTKKSILFLGDTHGDYDWIKIISGDYTDCAIVHVGDIGLGFHSYKTENEILTKKLLPVLQQNNNDLFLMRGNHDSKQRFAEFRKQNLSYIHFPEDYEVVELNNKKFMFVGGAISIDRFGRTPGHSYWSDEVVVFEKDKCQEVDVLVTHTAPSWCYPQTVNDMVLGWAREDKTLLEDLKKERNLLDNIFYLTKPSLHVYGHFHSNWNETINNCKHKLMDINEVWEDRNL